MALWRLHNGEESEGETSKEEEAKAAGTEGGSRGFSILKGIANRSRSLLRGVSNLMSGD